MPTTIKELIGGVRDYLGQPDHGSLSNATVLLRLQDKIDHLRNLMDLTDQNWLLQSWLLTVDLTNDTYAVIPGDWGRPILCHTVDETDAYHVKREVPIIDLQDENLYYVGPNTSTTSVVYPHDARSFAFFRRDGQLHVKVQPVPSASATYQFWYEPGRPTPPTLSDNYPLLEAFTNLVKVDTALSCLPNCINAENAAAMKLRLQVLGADKADYKAAFDVYITQDRQEQTGKRRGFGADFPDDGAWS